MPYTAGPHLLLERDGAVATVTLNNPDQLNCFLEDMHVGMYEIWPALADDPEVRAVVLTGAGRAFCSGGDVPSFVRQREDPAYRRTTLVWARRMLDAMADFPKPVVAAVNGPAVGLGCSVAIMCDIVVMAESAYLADPHVSIGLVAGDGGAAVWPLLTGLLRAKEYLLTGERIIAAEARVLGLANRVVPDAEVAPFSADLAARLAAQPPQAVQDTKRALNLHLKAALSRVAPFALASEYQSFDTAELGQSVERFRGRRGR